MIPLWGGETQKLHCLDTDSLGLLLAIQSGAKEYGFFLINHVIIFFLSPLVVSDSLRPHGLYSSWNSPGPNTGMGSLSLHDLGSLQLEAGCGMREEGYLRLEDRT